MSSIYVYDLGNHYPSLGKSATLQDIFAVILIAVLRVKRIQSDQYLVKKCVSIDETMMYMHLHRFKSCFSRLVR